MKLAEPVPANLRRLRPVPLLVPALAAAWLAPVQAQQRGLTVLPTASVTETVTDNALLSNADKRSDAISQIAAGISMSAKGQRVQGVLDYQLTGTIHARETQANATTQSMRAAMNAEVVDNWMFLQVSSAISRQAISAFGVQSLDPTIDNANRTELRTLNVSPLVRGQIGRWAEYVAQVNIVRQSSAASDIGDSDTRTTSVVVSAAGAPTVGWDVQAMRQRIGYQRGRDNGIDNLTAGMNFRPNADWRLSLRGGREESSVLTSADTHSNTWGASVDWIPDERTRLSVRRDHRFYGDGHYFSFDYRLPRSSIQFRSSRDISTPMQTLTGASVSFADLLDASLAAQVPDAVQRRQLVEQELQRRGISGNTLVSVGFLTSAVTLVNRQDLSLTWRGTRQSLLVSAFRSESRRLDDASSAFDDLSQAENVRQVGLSVTLSHRLTPISDLSLLWQWQRNRGATSSQDNTLRSTSLNWTSRLGKRGSISAGLRRVEFDSISVPYTESAVFATVSLRF